MKEYKKNKYRDNCFYHFRDSNANMPILPKLIYLSNVISIIISAGFVEELEHLYYIFY